MGEGRTRPRPEAPAIVVSRLPLYLRALSHLEGIQEITSQALGGIVGISAAQIRKDLSYFGGSGKQGAGYDVQRLRKKLAEILQVDREWPVILVGVGNLGQAIAGYGGFSHQGFRLVALFDNSSAKIGGKVAGLLIEDVAGMPERVGELGVKVGIIAVPASEAQKVANSLVAAGVQALLNYAPVNLDVPSGVQVYHIDPVIGLQGMTYYLRGLSQ